MGDDYLVNLHLNLPPYNTMSHDKAIEAIKLHCGIIRHEGKFVSNMNFGPTMADDMVLDMARYASITSPSQEEDCMTGSEEYYIEKWIERSPYCNMPREEAEKLILSKLTIVHRNTDTEQVSGEC